MFDKLNKQIDALDAKKGVLDADWEQEEHPLLMFYVKIIPLALNAERCSIFIYDPDKEITWLKVGTGLEERDIEVTGEYETVVGKVITTGEAKIASGLDKENNSGIHKQLADKTGFVTRDILCVPIKSLDGTKVTGAVQLLNKKDGTTFNDDDLQLVTELAHYLELTIENIFFNQEITGVLRGVSKALMTLISAILWLVGLSVVAIIARVLWVGLKTTT